MLKYVSAAWVQEHLDAPDILVLDPRSPLRYTSGHPKNAVNAPVAKARDAEANLLPVPELARWLESVGFDYSRKPVVYDSADGRNAAMLAWILLYLGCREVHLMESLWECWVEAKREVFYKPVLPQPRHFQAKPRPELRATLDQVSACGGARLIDFRSREEFTGEINNAGRPGHIPGARNIVWGALSGRDGKLFAEDSRLREVLSEADIAPGQASIAYCHYGARAALGFLALAKIGQPVALFDGSYAEWVRCNQPVEISDATGRTEKKE